jgi:enoyl-CoA hydratase/carnithine racemase
VNNNPRVINVQGETGKTMQETMPFVLKEQDDRGVVRLTLNRAQSFNALSHDMLAALHESIEAIQHDENARVVILATSGKAFCAGHDLVEMRANPSQAFYEKLFAQCSQLMLAIRSLPVPVIAQVNGVATAAGCQLVAMCDLAVATDHSRFAVSGVNLGLFCSTPSVALSRNVPMKTAFEMLVTGDFISAQQALDKGLINAVAAPAELEAQTQRIVTRILAKPRHGIAVGKNLFYQQIEQPIAQAYEQAGAVMACNMMHETAQEGVQAFIEKRPPRW